MKKILVILVSLVAIIASSFNVAAQPEPVEPRSISVTTPDNDLMEFHVLSEENKTVEIYSYTFSKKAKNENILNIPAEVTYEGTTYSVSTIPTDFETYYYYSGKKRKYAPIKILNIQNGIKCIEDSAFYGNILTEINLPYTLQRIGRYAFEAPTREEIHLDPPCGSPDPIYVSHDVTCPLFISNLVEIISPGAFFYNDFTNVTIGQNVKVIYGSAFGKIQNLTCYAKTPPLSSEYSIENIDETKLLVPPGCKEIYEQDENWGKAASIEEYDEYVKVVFDDVDMSINKFLKGRLFKGQTRTLHPKITWLHEGSSERFRYWYSSDENVATVDQNGVITAKNFGEATITFMIEDERGIPSSCSYDVLVTTSADVDIIESDDTDTTVEVFTLNGVKVGDSTDNLPAGFYIVKSAKEAKRICIK